MDFPIQPLMDEDACYHFLLDLFHPEGLRCPRCQARDGFLIHRYYREPVLDYRCPACGRVFSTRPRQPRRSRPLPRVWTGLQRLDRDRLPGHSFSPLDAGPRHTATQIYRRLQDEHAYPGSYPTVRRYVAAHHRRSGSTFVPLAHPPGHRLVAESP